METLLTKQVKYNAILYMFHNLCVSFFFATANVVAATAPVSANITDAAATTTNSAFVASLLLLRSKSA